MQCNAEADMQRISALGLVAGLALLGGAYLYVLVRRKKPIEAEYLLVGGALYAVFLAVALVTIL